MTAHKEHVMDEKRFCSRFGVTCVTSYSDPIYTRDFDSFEAFFAALQAAWDKSWGEVFSADPARKRQGALQWTCMVLQSFLLLVVCIAAGFHRCPEVCSSTTVLPGWRQVVGALQTRVFVAGPCRSSRVPHHLP
eukprot:GHUV01016611.1.p6 GENE.GHUV01016611.1~~GHUV01016611.1.p6  ORF type:complete len:134 (+),score=26.83 GHUV01016611.1:1515-1916(+)